MKNQAHRNKWRAAVAVTGVGLTIIPIAVVAIQFASASLSSSPPALNARQNGAATRPNPLHVDEIAASEKTTAIESVFGGDSQYITITNATLTGTNACPPRPIRVLRITNSHANKIDFSHCASIDSVELESVTVEHGINFSYSAFKRLRIEKSIVRGAIDGDGAHADNLDIRASRVYGQISLRAQIDSVYLGSRETLPPYPTACVSRGNIGDVCTVNELHLPTNMMTVKELVFRDARVGSLNIHNVYVAGATDARHLRAERAIDLRRTWFAGAVNFDHVRASGFGMPEIVAEAGLSVFGARIDGNIDLAYAEIRRSFYALGIHGDVIQLSGAVLIDPASDQNYGESAFTIAIQSGSALRLNSTTVVGAPLRAQVAGKATLDVRAFSGDLAFSGREMQLVIFDAALPLSRDSDMVHARFEDFRDGVACERAGILCQQGRAVSVNTANAIEGWLRNRPHGTAAILDNASSVVDDADVSDALYFSARYNHGWDTLFILTGDGRRHWTWYVAVVIGVYLISVAVFWKQSATPAWFALAVLLPSFLDIGVRTRTPDDNLPWGDNRPLTHAFHAFHVIGWAVISLAVYVITRRFG